MGGTPRYVHRSGAEAEVVEGTPCPGQSRIGGTDVVPDRNRQTISFEKLAYSNMLQVQALVELLEEKGLLTRQEVLERVKQLRAEMAGKGRAR